MKYSSLKTNMSPENQLEDVFPTEIVPFYGIPKKPSFVMMASWVRGM